MKARFLLPALALLCLAPSAFADAKLAQQKACMACHSADKKIIGPAFKDVAAKYTGQSNAVTMLAQKIVKGGSGVWGAVPMPANPNVSPAEARQLAEWVLSIK